ncbi:MAG: purine-nucleoside phosphorylase [bacterium]|nr:purine-nucleoside phosphorylase [bacterium]
MSQEPAAGIFERLDETVAAIRDHLGDGSGLARPQVGMILGSGLGSFADRFEDAVAVDYGDIPHFPVSGVEGHAGRLVFGRMGGLNCVAMQGRVHYYEGHDLATVTFPARALVRLGAGTLIITNAAGGISDRLDVGSLMVIRDHLNLFGANPLRGHNDERLGPRFPDLSQAYAAELRTLAGRAADAAGATIKEGVYAGLAGPSYETPAEIEMLRRLGGDAVGMSTVPEVIVANHMGARVLGISCITNLAAGPDSELSHDEVTEVAKQVESTFVSLLTRILEELAEEDSRQSVTQRWLNP